MNKVFQLFLSGAVLFPAIAQPAVLPASKLAVELKLYGNSAESTSSHARIVGSEVEARFEDQLAPQLLLQLAGGIQIETGATQSRWEAEFRPRSVQRLRQAQIAWSPHPVITLTAGAVDQDRLESPLLLQRQTFPALHESLQLPAGSLTFGLSAQQSVANDTSSIQPWSSGGQGLPAFYIERVSLAYEPNDALRLAFHGSHFSFQNLGGPNVFASQFMGNTISGADAADALYVYGYQGFEAGAVARFRLGQFTPELRATWLQNMAAPAGRSQGWKFTAGVEYQPSIHFKLIPQGELFHMESDAAPAFYNDRVFGHNNRNGFGARLTALWPKQGMEVFARWVHSSVIQAHPFQSDLDWLQLQFSAQYDVL